MSVCLSVCLPVSTLKYYEVCLSSLSEHSNTTKKCVYPVKNHSSLQRSPALSINQSSRMTHGMSIYLSAQIQPGISVYLSTLVPPGMSLHPNTPVHDVEPNCRQGTSHSFCDAVSGFDVGPAATWQVLRHLLQNSIKFTQQGVIEVTAEQVGDYVRVHVQVPRL
eukprot:713876-Rhodomonas_salina.2